MNPILAIIRQRIGPVWSSVIGFFAALGYTTADLSSFVEKISGQIDIDGGNFISATIVAIIGYLVGKPQTETEVVRDVDTSPVKPPKPVLDESVLFDDYAPEKPVQEPEQARQTYQWKFGLRSLERLTQAHIDLQRVHKRGLQLSPLDFSIIETTRTAERQAQLKAEGKSLTLDSRHVETPAMAVDHVPLVDGKACWDWWAFEITTDALKQAAKELGVDCDFGIDWKSFPDGAHIELNRNVYPKIDVELA